MGNMVHLLLQRYFEYICTPLLVDSCTFICISVTTVQEFETVNQEVPCDRSCFHCIVIVPLFKPTYPMVLQNKCAKILLCGRMDRNHQCNVGMEREVKLRKCPETLHKSPLKSLEDSAMI